MNDEIRYRMMNGLDLSASHYADSAEKRISQLQQAYLKKYQPWQHSYSANVSQHPQGGPGPFEGFRNTRSAPYDLPEFGRGFESASAVPSEEGIADVTHEFQLVY